MNSKLRQRLSRKLGPSSPPPVSCCCHKRDRRNYAKKLQVSLLWAEKAKNSNCQKKDSNAQPLLIGTKQRKITYQNNLTEVKNTKQVKKYSFHLYKSRIFEKARVSLNETKQTEIVY